MELVRWRSERGRRAAAADSALGGSAPADTEQREFDLRRGVTLVGSAPDADLQLPGLDARHAEVRRQAGDEYVWVDLGACTPVTGSRWEPGP
jgi:hypothetical protein